MILAPVIRQRFFDSNGKPLSGGKLYSYVAGTTTPQATYSDQGGASPNANPVVLDANGEANVWLDPSLAYKFVLNDSNDVTQWTIDQISGAGITGVPQWNANSNYAQGNVVLDSSGVGILYVSLQNNNVGNPLSNVSYWRAMGGNIRTVTASTALVSTDEVVLSNSTSASLTHTLPACSSTPVGKRITIKDVGTGGNTTTIKGSGTDNVDGANTYSHVLHLNDGLTFINSGSAWLAANFLVPDSGVTTTKIADGAVTQAKLQARATGTTVAAGGLAISASCGGSFTANTTTPTDVTNLSVTITTTGRPVRLELISDGSGNPSCVILNNSGTNTAIDVLLLYCRNGTVIGTDESMAGTVISAGYLHSTYLRLPPKAFGTVDTPAAGTYTYKVQMQGGSNGDPNGAMQYCKLIAYEI